jgi:pimeloyl-ACP methyl ester carboxylesterase
VAVFALAHMSCAGAWAWGSVPDLLRAASHEVVVPDLPLRAGVTPAEHGALLAAAAGVASPPRSVVLAGHSYGGLVVAEAARVLGPAVAALVVVDGFVPEDGESAFDLTPPERVSGRRAEASARGDGMWTPGSPGRFAPSWWTRMTPMPVSAFEAPVAVPAEVRALPGWFVHCVGEDFAEQAARARERGWTVVEVDGPHALPLVDPATCGEVLLDAARSVRPSP